MQSIYLYSLQKIHQEAISEINGLREEALKNEDIIPGALTVVAEGRQNKPEIRFDVSSMDYETKHEMDVKIRKILKKHKLPFIFSNPGHTKVNFFYSQKITN